MERLNQNIYTLVAGGLLASLLAVTSGCSDGQESDGPAVAGECDLYGVKYSDGSKVCQNGTWLHCDDTSWGPGESCE